MWVEELDLDKILSERTSAKNEMESSTASYQSCHYNKSMSLKTGDTIKKEENIKLLSSAVMSILDNMF